MFSAVHRGLHAVGQGRRAQLRPRWRHCVSLMSVPNANWATTSDSELADVDGSASRRGTLLMACSMGTVTCGATSSAPAPGMGRDDGHDGQLDVRQQLLAELAPRDEAAQEQADRDEQHDALVAQGELGEPDHRVPSWCGRGRWGCRGGGRGASGDLADEAGEHAAERREIAHRRWPRASCGRARALSSRIRSISSAPAAVRLTATCRRSCSWWRRSSRPCSTSRSTRPDPVDSVTPSSSASAEMCSESAGRDEVQRLHLGHRHVQRHELRGMAGCHGRHQRVIALGDVRLERADAGRWRVVSDRWNGVAPSDGLFVGMIRRNRRTCIRRQFRVSSGVHITLDGRCAVAWRLLASRAMTAPALIPPGPSRRRAGAACSPTAWSGVLLMGGLFVATVAVAFMGRDGFTRIDETIDEVVAVIDSTSAALVPGGHHARGRRRQPDQAPPRAR